MARQPRRPFNIRWDDSPETDRQAVEFNITDQKKKVANVTPKANVPAKNRPVVETRRVQVPANEVSQHSPSPQKGYLKAGVIVHSDQRSGMGHVRLGKQTEVAPGTHVVVRSSDQSARGTFEVVQTFDGTINIKAVGYEDLKVLANGAAVYMVPQPANSHNPHSHVGRICT